MTIGERVKSLRTARRMSLQDVATRATISKTHVWDLETEACTNPTITTVYAVANALGVSVAEILGLENSGPNLHPEAMRIALEIDQLLCRDPSMSSATDEFERLLFMAKRDALIMTDKSERADAEAAARFLKRYREAARPNTQTEQERP